MCIRWANAAAADMQGISDYLKDNNPHYWQPTMREPYDRIRGLSASYRATGPRGRNA